MYTFFSRDRTKPLLSFLGWPCDPGLRGIPRAGRCEGRDADQLRGLHPLTLPPSQQERQGGKEVHQG